MAGKRHSREELKKLTSHPKFRQVMKEFSRGTLKSSNGETVTNQDQAFQIAISEAKNAKK